MPPVQCEGNWLHRLERRRVTDGRNIIRCGKKSHKVTCWFTEKSFSTRPVSALFFCESTLQNYLSNRPLQLIFTDNSDLVKAFDWRRSDNLSWFDIPYPAGRFRVVSSEVVHRVHLDDWRVFQFRQRSQFFTFHPQIRLDEDRIIVCCLLPTEGRGRKSSAGPRVSDCTARTQPTAQKYQHQSTYIICLLSSPPFCNPRVKNVHQLSYQQSTTFQCWIISTC